MQEVGFLAVVRMLFPCSLLLVTTEFLNGKGKCIFQSQWVFSRPDGCCIHSLCDTVSTVHFIFTSVCTLCMMHSALVSRMIYDMSLWKYEMLAKHLSYAHVSVSFSLASSCSSQGHVHLNPHTQTIMA